MGWPDVSRWIWSYVISRLKLFTDLDPSKLELSARSLSVANVEIDKERLSIPGVETTQFVVGKLKVELTSTGLAIAASDVNIDAVMKSLEPPDLAISRILEQTRTDMEGYGGGDMSGVKSRFADFALSQVRSHITNISATLHYPNSDMVIRVHVDQIVMNQKHRIEIESIVFTRGFESDSDSYSESSSSESGSEDARVNDSDDENDRDHDRMAQSVLFGKRGSVFANSSLMRSVYFDAEEGGQQHHRSPQRDEEELATVNHAILNFSMEPLEFAFDVDSVRVDGLLVLQCVVETLNLVWKSAPAQNGVKSSIKSELSITSLEIHESLAESSGLPLSLKNICLKDEKLDVEGLDIPNVVNISPLLTAVSEENKLKIDMMMPVSVSLSIDSIPFAHSLAKRIGDILSELEPPPEPQPTQIDICLPEFRLAIGQNFTLLIFPESLSNAGFTLREILLRASEGQLLIRNLECHNKEGTDTVKCIIDELRVRSSAGFVNELHTLGLLLSGGNPDDIQYEPHRTWKPIDMPNTYWKIQSLLIEDSEKVLMRGDMELRTVGADADLRANLDFDHKRSKTVFEVSAYSTDGLASIESTLSVFDCDIFLEQYIAGDSQVFSSPPAGGSYMKNNATVMPQIRTKLDFGNGIRVHFPDEHKSVFMISLDITQVIVATDGAASLSVPELFVKLEDNGGDISLIKVQDLVASHFLHGDTGPQTHIKVKSIALATCPDTYSLLMKLPVLVIPPPTPQHFDVDPDTSVDIFKDVVQTRFRSEELRTSVEEDQAVTLDSIEIKEDYMADQTSTNSTDATDVIGSINVKSTVVKFNVKVFQWQMFDGFDLERTRTTISETVHRIETAVSDVSESDKDTDDDEDDKIVVGDFMYNSVLVVAQGGRGGPLLSKQIARELGGSGSQGYDRSPEPKLTLTLKKCEIEQHYYADSRAQLSVSIRDGKVADSVPTSAFTYLLSRNGISKQKFLVYTQETLGLDTSPELRVTLAVEPLQLQLDQDTVEFLNRFFQFDIDDEVAAAAITERSAVSPVSFFQRFEFCELPLIIDYTPKKVDYKSLRSGVAAELVNLFVVKGAKLSLKPGVLHGINGWDRLFQELAGLWAPDIRANQLNGLLSGISPIRKALKLGKGLKSWAIVPMRSKRTGQVTRGAGLVVRRTMDELLRLRTAWLDSTDKALGGDTDPDPVIVATEALQLSKEGELNNVDASSNSENAAFDSENAALNFDNAGSNSENADSNAERGAATVPSENSDADTGT